MELLFMTFLHLMIHQIKLNISFQINFIFRIVQQQMYSVVIVQQKNNILNHWQQFLCFPLGPLQKPMCWYACSINDGAFFLRTNSFQIALNTSLTPLFSLALVTKCLIPSNFYSTSFLVTSASTSFLQPTMQILQAGAAYSSLFLYAISSSRDCLSSRLQVRIAASLPLKYMLRILLYLSWPAVSQQANLTLSLRRMEQSMQVVGDTVSQKQSKRYRLRSALLPV